MRAHTTQTANSPHASHTTKGLSKFASKGVNDKVTFAFHLFDVDGSGSISADEFVAAFKQGYKSTAWGEQSQTVIGDGARSKFLDVVEQVHNVLRC